VRLYSYSSGGMSPSDSSRWRRAGAEPARVRQPSRGERQRDRGRDPGEDSRPTACADREADARNETNDRQSRLQPVDRSECACVCVNSPPPPLSPAAPCA